MTDITRLTDLVQYLHNRAERITVTLSAGVTVKVRYPYRVKVYRFVTMRDALDWARSEYVIVRSGIRDYIHAA